MKRIRNWAAAAIGGAALVASAALHAATFGEDAGQTLASASIVTIANTTSIVGGIANPADADLYGVMLTAGTPFSARSAAGAGAAILDTQLFLFDRVGNGIRYNDDIEVTDFYSRISFTPSATGIYYIGISAVGLNPQDASGTFIYTRDPFDSTATPLPSPAGALASWAADGSGFEDQGAYSIDVAGVSPVPEPSTAVGLLAGLLMFGALRRRLFDRR